MGKRIATLDDAADRIVGHVRRNNKIVDNPSPGALVDELSNVLNRMGTIRGHRGEFILAAVDRAVQNGDLERFDDEFGVIIALPNEWPPASLQAFITISELDFEPIINPSLLRHVRGTKAWHELSTY